MNATYSTNPGYIDLVKDMYVGFTWFYRLEGWENYSFPQDFFDDFNELYSFPLDEAMPILYLSLLFTIIRYLFEIFVCKPLVNWIQINSKSEGNKFPESAWKFIIYSGLWSYVVNIAIFDPEYNYFFNSHKIWDDWAIGMPIANEIKWVYVLECGFYVHSVYATLFMDEKRKDFVAMLIHHFLTLVLLIVSYGTRFHKVGILVLFVHDATDILLEFSKCNIYLKNRGGKFYSVHENISNIGFVAFLSAWYLFRLYWFPLKVLYTSGVISAHRTMLKGAKLYGFFNSLLWILLCLDIYWFYFILVCFYKIVFENTMKDPTVNEEEEEKDDNKIKKS